MTNTEQHSRLHEILEDLLQLAKEERAASDRSQPARD